MSDLAKYLEIKRAAEIKKDGEPQTEEEWHKPAIQHITKRINTPEL